MHSPERPPMTIIGFGRIGQVYTELFTPDFDVSVVSSRNLHREVSDVGARQVNFEEAIAGADYVVPTVPLSALGEVADKISPLVHPETVVFDTTSVKVKALRTLGGLSCRYFSTHLLSKTEMAICGGTDQLVEEALQRQGLDILHMSPEEHDRANAIMGMAQLIGLALGNELSEEDRVALARSTSGKTLLALVDHIDANVPTTYAETQLYNEFTAQQRARLIEALRDYDLALTQGEFPSRVGEQQ